MRLRLSFKPYKDELSRVCTANPDVHLSVGRDPIAADQPVLLVEYPAPTGNAAARDVRCDAEIRTGRPAGTISFQVKPANPLRLSVSFLDRNGVAYTAWTNLQGGVWQVVRIPFAEIRPNPYFQPPGAKTGAPLDVSDVKWIAFAPQDQASGRTGDRPVPGAAVEEGSGLVFQHARACLKYRPDPRRFKHRSPAMINRARIAIISIAVLSRRRRHRPDAGAAQHARDAWRSRGRSADAHQPRLRVGDRRRRQPQCVGGGVLPQGRERRPGRTGCRSCACRTSASPSRTCSTWCCRTCSPAASSTSSPTPPTKRAS